MPRLGDPNFKNPLENPEEANAEIAAVLGSSSSQEEKPVIDHPPSDLVELPGGYINEKGEISRHAKVRELTGEDEELMARAVMSNNTLHFINTIIDCGVVQIGNEPVTSKKKILQDMLIGDKEQLFVAIRIATYGNEVKIDNWTHLCGYQTDLIIHLDGEEQDIQMKKLEHPETEISFEVPLWKGGKVRVRLAKGSDQTAVYDDPKRTKAEADTKLLSLCIERVYDENGVEIAGAFVPSYAQKLGLMDRKKILKELIDRQPGPRLNNIEFDCQGCGEKVSLAVGLEELFLNFELLSNI